MFTFILDSDIHYGKRENNGPRTSKQRNSEYISEELDVDFAIVAGDLTENGYDGKRCCCFKYGGFSNQLKALKEQYIEPIEYVGIPAKLCVGNHDRGRPPYIYQPVFRYVKKRHGDIQYSFDHKNVRFICCGLYPKDTKWLKKQLKSNQANIIYFHYNLEGAWSDWWTEKEKNKFYKTIKGYPIAAILVGHQHSNKQSKWKDIDVIKCAYRGYAKITCDKNGYIDDVDFITIY